MLKNPTNSTITNSANVCFTNLTNINLPRYNPSPNRSSSYFNIKHLKKSLDLQDSRERTKEFLDEFLSHLEATVVTKERRKNNYQRPSKTVGCFTFLFIKDEMLRNANINVATLSTVNATHGTLEANFNRVMSELISKDKHTQVLKLLASYVAGLAFTIGRKGGQYPEELDTNFLILSKIDRLSKYLKTHEIDKIKDVKKIIEEKAKPILPVRRLRKPPPGFEHLNKKQPLTQVVTLTYPAPLLLPTTSPIAANKNDTRNEWQTRSNNALPQPLILTPIQYKRNTNSLSPQSLFYTKELNPNIATKSLEPTW